MHRWLYSHCEPLLVGKASLEGAILMDLGGFPGIRVGDGTVHGEVWALPWATVVELTMLSTRSKLYEFSLEQVEPLVADQHLKARAFFFKGFKDGKARGIKVIKDGTWKSQ